MMSKESLQKMTLKELRLRANLRQKELAEKLGVTKATVSHWKTGTFKMNKLTKLAIANVLGVDWETIKNTPNNKPKKTIRLDKKQC